MIQRIYRTIFLASWLRLLVIVLYTRILWFFRNQLFRKCLRILAGVVLFCVGVTGILLPFVPGIFFFIPAIHILFGKNIIQIARRIIKRWRRFGRTPGA
jgi:hypothetical protein